MIPRLIYIQTKFYSKTHVKKAGLDSFFNKDTEPIEILRYKVFLNGIILQETGTTNLHIAGVNDKIIISRGFNEYCHWHNGPLDRRDNPLERTYCIKQPVSELGFCREHLHSDRAIYIRCFGTAGLESMRNCIVLDKKYGEKIEYVVYLLSYGQDSVKVGTTRSFRVYERIAEQPHVVATLLTRTKSAYRARDIEVRAGKLPWLTERPRRSIKNVISKPVQPALYRLKSFREKTLRALNISIEQEPIYFQVVPVDDMSYYMKAKETRLQDMDGKELEILGFWGGYLLVSETSTNNYYLIRSKELLHKDTVKIIS